jgi:exodeoxyribonuclease V alpha subunit
MVIVDEASMLDLILFYNLLKALRPETHLMLVGDVDQLPSVGAGNVLRDVIDSEAAHVTRLKTIFRQSDDSHIVVNAHRVNNGQALHRQPQRDFFFFGENDQFCAERSSILSRTGCGEIRHDPINDIQVIAPMYRGPAGVNALNQALQQALNGDRRMAEKQLFGRLFRVGDKVMQTKNNYDKEVFNGDIGRIYGIDFEESVLEVVIDGRYIYYEFSETEELMLAYCISTHRSQGQSTPSWSCPSHAALHDAPAQPALHRHHPRQTGRRAGGQPPGHLHGRQQQQGRRALQRAAGAAESVLRRSPKP